MPSVIWNTETKNALLIRVGRRINMNDDTPVVQSLERLWLGEFFTHLRKGWNFNTQYNKTFHPKTVADAVVVLLADNALDIENPRHDFYIIKNSVDNGAYIFDTVLQASPSYPVTLWKTIVTVPVYELPPEHYNMLLDKVASVFVMTNSGDAAAARMLQNSAAQALTEIKSKEIDRKTVNAYESPNMRRRLSRIARTRRGWQ